jgi:hypothetical protein
MAGASLLTLLDDVASVLDDWTTPGPVASGGAGRPPGGTRSGGPSAASD